MKYLLSALSAALCYLPLFVSGQGESALPANSPATSATGTSSPSDPNLVSTAPQAGEPNFSWIAGVTSTGTSSPSDRNIVFQTLSNTAVVGYVDLHYTIDNQDLSNWRMSNDTTSPTYFYHTVTLQPSDLIQFNFTYLSLATNTEEITYTYEYSMSSNSIRQVTVIVVPQAGTVVTGPVQQDSTSNFNWQPAIQRYINVPNYYTVEFRSTSASVTNNWVNVHYIITDMNGIDGALKNYRMTQNNSMASIDGSNYYYYSIDGISGGDKLKFNFTYWDSINGVAVDTIAFLWSPESNVINYINNIADTNVDVNPAGGVAVYGSTGSSSSNTNGNNNANGATGTNGSNNNNNNDNNNNNNNNVVNKNGAVGQASSGAVATFACIVAAIAAMRL